MKRFLLLTLTFSCLPVAAQKPLGEAITDLARQITTSATKQEKQKIAVLPLHELDGQTTELGSYLAEELVTNLFQLGNFKIVERQHLSTLLGELKMQQSGAIDPATAKEIGRIAAVDAIVTGSITDLEEYVAVNCRLIDTTTGEVFGAAQTKITKDENVRGIARSILLTAAGASSSRTVSETSRPIATKDLGLLRVALTSVLPVTTRNGGGIMWTFEFINRDARRPMNVAVNARGREDETDDRARLRSPSVPVRASLVDDRGGLWNLSSATVGNIGVVRAGVHGRNGSQAYSATEIARLLRLQDTLGRNTDDPADGVTSRATSMGEGGSNYTFSSSGGNTSPEKFFAYPGNTFVSGSTTMIAPGQATIVTMTFESSRSELTPAFFQFQCEIVGGASASYTLYTLSFDRVSIVSR